ncbi:MAG TPA: TIGR04282 family arsenosugar biosynthesis glycosyltransferase [Gemmatimonadales bacterium]
MRALGILCRAPIPGQVKTRLADDVGDSAAVEVYSRIGRRVVAAAAGSGYRTIVWFTPPDEGAFVREWLDGVGRVEFRPQAAGPQGARIAAALARQFADGADRAVLIASDFPGLDRRLVTEAFAALARFDLILGPAVDGGYYLIGLREPQPDLFAGIPWATTAVLAQTRARAQRLGLGLHLLRPLRDVDTERDARALGYLNS